MGTTAVLLGDLDRNSIAMAGRQTRTWDPYKTYDITAEERAAIDERVRMRNQLKAEFQRKVTNPYRGVGGSVFDPAVQRFLSMRANYWHQFQPTPKGLIAPFCLIVMPVQFSVISFTQIGLEWKKNAEQGRSPTKTEPTNFYKTICFNLCIAYRNI